MTPTLRVLLYLARAIHGCPRWVKVDRWSVRCHCGAAEGEWHYGWAWEIYRRAHDRWYELQWR